MSKFDLLSRGLQIIDPSDFSALKSSSGTVSIESSGFPAGGPGKAVKLSYPATGQSWGTLAHPTAPYVECPYAQADLTGCLVEVYNPHGYPIPFTVALSNESGVTTNRFRAMAEVAAGWQLVFLPAVYDLVKLLTLTDEIKYVQYTMNTAAGDGWPHTTGATLFFGRVYFNPSQRPVFLLSTDDGRLGNVVPPASVVGFPASGTTFKGICDHYGFRATAYVIGKVLANQSIYQNNYMSPAQVLGLQDSGWSVCNHSYSHPWNAAGAGLRMLGPFGYATGYEGARNDDTAIYDDVMLAYETLTRLGLRGGRYITMPEGGWDPYVRTALIRAGMKSVRGTGSLSVIPVRGASYAAYPLAGSFWLSGFIDLFGVVYPEDPALTTAAIDAHIDELIRVGGTSTSCSHFIDAATATNFDYLCARLKTEQDAGNLRVMTIEEYYDQQYDFGGRTFFSGPSHPPVALSSNAIGRVSRVGILTGSPSPSAAEINNMIEFGKR